MSFICSSVNQHLRMIYYIVIDHRVSGQRNALPTTHTSSQYQHSQAKQKKKSKKKKKKKEKKQEKNDDRSHNIKDNEPSNSTARRGSSHVQPRKERVFTHTSQIERQQRRLTNYWPQNEKVNHIDSQTTETHARTRNTNEIRPPAIGADIKKPGARKAVGARTRHRAQTHRPQRPRPARMSRASAHRAPAQGFLPTPQHAKFRRPARRRTRRRSPRVSAAA
jgi:hypothetical protein